VNLRLFEEVRYTSELELLLICTVAEQMLSLQVHSLKLQLDDGVWISEVNVGYWKCKVQTYFSVHIQLYVVTHCPGLYIYGKHLVDVFHQKIC
jgi:hypothetical protein